MEEFDRAASVIHEKYELERADLTKKRIDLETQANEKALANLEREGAKLLEIAQARKRMAEEQERLNYELEQSSDTFAGMREGARSFRRSVGTDFEQGARMMESGLQSISDHSADAFSGFVNGSMTAAEAFKSFAGSVLQDISKMIVKMLVLKAVESAVGFATGGRSLSTGEMNWYDAQPDPFAEGPGGFDSFNPLANSAPSMAMAKGPGSGGTVVVQNFNISAVDQQGVAKLFASPEFQRAQRGAQITNEKFNTATRVARR